MPNPTKIVLKWTTTNKDAINRAHVEVLADGTIIRNADPGDQPRFGVVHGFGEELISIAAVGMRGATLHDFGDYPITERQIDSMCAEAARLSLVYGIPIQAGTVFTHAEHALSNGYGLGSGAIKEVWDLEVLQPVPTAFVYDHPRHVERATLTATLLRNRIKVYVSKMIAWNYPKKAAFDPDVTLLPGTWFEYDSFGAVDKIYVNDDLRTPTNTDDTMSVSDDVTTQLN